MTDITINVPVVFTPTRAMIEAAEDLFLAMAYEQTVRPIVEAYKTKILAERIWLVAPDKQRRTPQGEVAEERITNIADDWLMSHADSVKYAERCNEERIAANLRVEKESQCPLLVAQHQTAIARQLLCEIMADSVGLDVIKITSAKREEYDKFVDLCLRLLAPYAKNPLGNSPTDTR